MTVYVDPIMKWPTRIPCFRGGSCHMFADTEAELHTFAGRLGMKRGWFQHAPGGAPHYDLTQAKRRRAVALGAIEVDLRKAAEIIARVRR